MKKRCYSETPRERGKETKKTTKKTSRYSIYTKDTWKQLWVTREMRGCDYVKQDKLALTHTTKDKGNYLYGSRDRKEDHVVDRI